MTALELHHSDMTAGALRKAHARGAVGRMTGELMREWEMRARLNVMVRRGEIAPEVVLVPEGHTLHAYFIRLKPARSRWTLPAWLTLAAAGTLSAVAWLVWESRYVFLALGIGIVSATVLAAVVGMIASAATGCSCVIHGPRCKG
jgi:hypothetical protein